MKNGHLKGDTTALARHLLEAVQRAQESLQQVEIWAGALSAFSNPVPEYRPDSRFLLGAHPTTASNGHVHHADGRGPNGSGCSVHAASGD